MIPRAPLPGYSPSNEQDFEPSKWEATVVPNNRSSLQDLLGSPFEEDKGEEKKKKKEPLLK
jgi:hypothetical protein